MLDGIHIIDTEHEIIDSSNVTNHRRRRSKAYLKSMKCTDDTDSDSDIICSQGKVQELKQAKMSIKNAKVPSTKKTI